MGCSTSKEAGNQPSAKPKEVKVQDKVEPLKGGGVVDKVIEEKNAKIFPADSNVMPIEIRSFESKYKLQRSLGKGRYGVVKTCVDLESGEEFAVKIINGRSMKSEGIINDEVYKLKRVEHPNVVQFYDFFKDASGLFYIVMELCRGGDLFSRIVEDGSYTEARAAELLRQLASALSFIHSRGITHRDLKPENILLSSKEEDAMVKIVDFGLSKIVKDENYLMTTVIGTWAYCAPEVFSNQPYTNAVDTWAVGILMFIMLSGYHPFDPYGELTDGELISRVTNDDFDFDEPEWQEISADAKKIIRQLLQKDASKRLSLQDFLETPWVRGNASDKNLTKSLQRMQSFPLHTKSNGPDQ